MSDYSIRRTQPESSPSAGAGHGWPRRLLGHLNLVAIPVLLLVLWQVASMYGWVDRTALASPQDVWAALLDHLGDGSLQRSIAISLQRVVLGSALGFAVGATLGLLSGLSNWGRNLFDGSMNMLHAMPFPALLPLLMIWLGIDEGLKIGLVAIGVTYPVFINLSRAIRGIDPRFMELAKTRQVSGLALLRQVIVPGALPGLLVGVRHALSVAWLCLVFAESIAADSGIGYLMMEAKRFVRTDVIILCLVIYSLLGLAVDGAVRLIEHYALAWRREFAQ